jgi:hypothetical protein
VSPTTPDPVDQAIAESFPASDPPSWAGQSTGARAADSLLGACKCQVEELGAACSESCRRAAALEASDLCACGHAECQGSVGRLDSDLT